MSPEPPVDVTGRARARRELDLDRFFHPRTIAVVGASDTPGRPAATMFARIRAWAEAHDAAVHPVNPNRREVGGVPCFATIADVPGDIDLAAILVGDAVAAFREVADRGARFAVVFAAGFAEAGPDGVARQTDLAELVQRSDTRLLGPNTNLNAFETFRTDLPGAAIALITQSGHQGRPVFQAQDLGIALSHWAPVGNEVDLEAADFIRYFVDQPEVGVVAAYVEGFKDGRTFALAADHAARHDTPIVVVKVGRTDEGRSMAQSHTGHLAGSDAVTDAVLRQYGVTRVDGLDELIDTAALFARTPRRSAVARSGRPLGVCIYAISGGTGAHLADLAAAAGLHLPELAPATQARLHEWIPAELRVANPVDSGGPPSADERGRKILDALIADPNVDVIVCPITGAVPSLSGPLAADLVAAAATTDKPICVIWGSPVGDEPDYREVLLGSRLPVFRTFQNCVRAVKALDDHQAFLERYRSPFARPARRRSPAARTVEPLLAGSGALSEHRSKAVLAAYGIQVTADRLAGSRAEAVRAAASIDGPVVLKVSSPALDHKSDLGLVRLGVAGPAAVRRAYGELLEKAAAEAPGAAVEGVLVCPMMTGGVETVVGVADDPVFGPTVLFGLGGVFVEVLGDVNFRVPPFDRAEARRMVHEVKGFPLLAGARGRPKADLGALVDVLLKVQRLAVDHAGSLVELDINPLLVLPKGAVALDALVVTR
ncbi:MAG: acetate--CoA ligase family protein [Acidimicrobiales bacterium]|nr:acetate--CoA ligase family protein [Acidimicrobiales bacterium]